ncbi:RNA polymerase subunit sigma-24 [Sporosarcina sp. P13]|uniref:RNA polymerase sigma factor n=1 Tax=Sporosarcina sp. P13 TaxID=2048263 RepID=UPI000C16B1C2|nr:RNA polymerase sigma factor [Sporosarcina sp. P13]PIC63942.1 RNA polymerase subunit sigma-24 [Sporosarcina sp. P13]
MTVIRLVKRAKRGNKDALLQLISEQQDDYYQLALKYMGNPHDAMDAMEEMIVSLYRHITTLKQNDAFYSWSKTILVNQCKQMLRKKARVQLLEEWETIEVPSDADPITQSEQRIDIEEMLSFVNVYQREAIELKYFYDLDYQTIADMTDVSLGTAKSRVFTGLEKMRNRYRGERDD